MDVAADRAMGHYTHEKSPVGCAAGLATIRYIEEHGLVAHARELGQYVLQRLTAMQERHPGMGDVRGRGLLLGVELVTNRATWSRATAPAKAVMYRALTKGLSFKVTMGNILTLTPPLIITREEMDRAMAILDECLTEVEAGR